jgi:hypothetical protein
MSSTAIAAPVHPSSESSELTRLVRFVGGPDQAVAWLTEAGEQVSVSQLLCWMAGGEPMPPTTLFWLDDLASTLPAPAVDA